MYALLQIVAVTVVLLLAQEALRRASRWAVWGIFLVMPLVLTPYWMRVNELGLFSWFKYYTVCFCVCWGTALRFTSLGKRAWARSTIPLLLAVNILEAVAVDLLRHGLAHGLNAAAGLLLISTLTYGQDSTCIHSASGCTDLHYKTSRRWVIGYTLWNWTFVYLNYPALAGHHCAVLAAGLIVAIYDPRRWGQTRASTLGFSLLLTATFYDKMVAWMDTSIWFDEQIAVLAAAVGLAFMSLCAAQLWRINALPREGFSSLVASIVGRWFDRRARTCVRLLRLQSASAAACRTWLRTAPRTRLPFQDGRRSIANRANRALCTNRL
jgi:uncharacterized protein DUF5692